MHSSAPSPELDHGPASRRSGLRSGNPTAPRPPPPVPRPQPEPGLRAAAGDGVFGAGQLRRAALHHHAAVGGRPARHPHRTAAARLAGAHRRQRVGTADPRHAGRCGLSAGHAVGDPAGVAGGRAGAVAAGRSRHAYAGCQRPDPRADVHGLHAGPAASRPRRDRRRHDRVPVLRRHGVDRAAARGRRVVAGAHGRRGGGPGRRVPVPAPGPRTAEEEVQLGDRGRGSRRAWRRRARTAGAARSPPAVGAPGASGRGAARGGAAFYPPSGG